MKQKHVLFPLYESLHELVGWLQNHGITHVAMENTLETVYYILEEYFELMLVNARHIKNVPGHKTDKKDSEWIAKLLLSGLLKGSFVPDQSIRELQTAGSSLACGLLRRTDYRIFWKMPISS